MRFHCLGQNKFLKTEKQLFFGQSLEVHLVPGTSSLCSSAKFPKRKIYNESFLADLTNQHFIEPLMLPLHPLMDHLSKLMTV